MPESCTFTIRVLGEDPPVVCADGESVLAAVERQRPKALRAGCRGGGCGVCRIRVRSGTYRKLPMSRRHVRGDDERDGLLLACRVYPTSDLEIQVLPQPAPQRPWLGKE